MAGLVFQYLPEANFWIQFFVSELIAVMAIEIAEVMPMIIKFVAKTKTFVDKLLKNVIHSLEVVQPYKFNLLMIWCNSSEKG